MNWIRLLFLVSALVFQTVAFGPHALSAEDAKSLASIAGGPLIPMKVKSLANSLAEKHFIAADKREQFVQGYGRGFLSGLTNPNPNTQYGSSKEKNPRSQGFTLGRENSLAGGHGVTLPDFGYKEVTEEGYVYLNFEQSEFRPLKSDEIWWISALVPIHEYHVIFKSDGGEQEIIKKGQDSRRYVIAHVKGFLSPPALMGYGHLGQGKRELVISEIVEVGRASNKPLQPTLPRESTGLK